MKKDNKWLEAELKGLKEPFPFPDRNSFQKGVHDTVDYTLHLMKQLDEPETTSRIVHDLKMENRKLAAKVKELKGLPIIPRFVADYLTNSSIYSLEERIALLIKSNDGDDFYFRDLLPQDNQITQEEGEKLYGYASNAELGDLLTLVNGYTIEKETRWVVKFQAGDFYDNLNEFAYFSEFINHKVVPIQPNGRTHKDDIDVYKFEEKDRAEAVALLIGGTVEGV